MSRSRTTTSRKKRGRRASRPRTCAEFSTTTTILYTRRGSVVEKKKKFHEKCPEKLKDFCSPYFLSFFLGRCRAVNGSKKKRIEENKRKRAWTSWEDERFNLYVILFIIVDVTLVGWRATRIFHFSAKISVLFFFFLNLQRLSSCVTWTWHENLIITSNDPLDAASHYQRDSCDAWRYYSPSQFSSFFSRFR